ncbi:MAG: hypothetical protein IPJ39_19245 [Saprospiraceae bacterium]|nr:hypothetical protein [Saprospiraceae bacterium]
MQNYDIYVYERPGYNTTHAEDNPRIKIVKDIAYDGYINDIYQRIPIPGEKVLFNSLYQRRYLTISMDHKCTNDIFPLGVACSVQYFPSFLLFNT